MSKQSANLENQAIERENPIFKFEGKDRVTTLTRDLIDQSLEVTDNRGNPLRNRPVQMAVLVMAIEEMIQRNGINYNVEPIFVQKNSSHRMLTKEEKLLYTPEDTPINKWLFDKAITKINLSHVGDKGENYAIAISYHDKGIQIAHGLNVQVCSNMSILGGESSFLQTFTRKDRERDSYDGILARLENMIHNFDRNRKYQMDIMNQMKEIPIQGNNIIDRIIGKLYQKAVDQAYGSKEIAPFSINNMSNFVQEMMKKRMGEEKLGNVWDIYNWGTSVIKPQNVDIIDVLPSNAEYANFLIEEFEIQEVE